MKLNKAVPRSYFHEQEKRRRGLQWAWRIKISRSEKSKDIQRFPNWISDSNFKDLLESYTPNLQPIYLELNPNKLSLSFQGF